MIAEACIASHLPPEAFGVPSSPELGAVIIGVLREHARSQLADASLRELQSRA